MSERALKVIFSFSVVIQIIAIFLFYITLPSEPGFVPIVLSFAIGMIVTIFSSLSIKKVRGQENKNTNLMLVFIIYFSVVTISILIRVLIIIFS